MQTVIFVFQRLIIINHLQDVKLAVALRMSHMNLSSVKNANHSLTMHKNPVSFILTSSHLKQTLMKIPPSKMRRQQGTRYAASAI